MSQVRIEVNTNYTRSINLERDARNENLIRGYILTTRVLQTIERISGTLHQEATPRAWALIGPYGSGKSAFAVFLAHLFGSRGAAASKAAWRRLDQVDSRLAAQFKPFQEKSCGYLGILVTGSPEPLSQRLIVAMASAVEALSKIHRADPSLSQRLSALKATPSVPVSEILALLTAVQAWVQEWGGKGVLLIIDELGKFLEYEARHPGTNDIYLLQALAEHASRAGDVNFQLVVMMHQAFEHYARGVSDSMKKEWLKVQGRFENLPFLEAAEQSLRVISAAIKQEMPDSCRRSVFSATRSIAAKLHELGALPAHLSVDAASELFAGCFPLHPLSALLLPFLCHRIAQNERTLFSYLGSQEPFGFLSETRRMALADNHLDWIRPDSLYEYFIHNQPSALTDPGVQRRWAEVVSAVERLGDAPEAVSDLLKTIGLMNLIGPQGGFKPSLELLNLLEIGIDASGELASNSELGAAQRSSEAVGGEVIEPSAVDESLAGLQSKSLIVYRRYNGEYRVWQGSDFDLEKALHEEISAIGAMSLADELNARNPISPIVARRYTIQTGTLRYFAPIFADIGTFQKLPANPAQPEIVFLLLEDVADDRVFVDVAKLSANQPLRIYSLPEIGSELRGLLTEIVALRQIQAKSSQLANDPIAQRELKDRLQAVVAREEALLTELLDDPRQSVWYWSGDRLQMQNRRDMQETLSFILDQLFPKTPYLRNELINRDRPSATANAAKKKLLLAMLNEADKQDLGIEKYPAEKGIYQSVLLLTQLHRRVDGQWRFADPVGGNDPQRILPLWAHIKDFFSRAERAPVPVSALFAELQARPFGLKAGLLPILFLAAFLANQDEIALFDEGAFSPVVTQEIIEKLLKDASLVAVQNVSLSGIRSELLKKYSETLLPGNQQSVSVLGLARPLAKMMRSLPEYTKRTKSISPEAQAVRVLFEKAKSPSDFLFSALPQACGFDPYAFTEDQIDAFASQLVGILRELKLAYPKLLSEVQTRLQSAFVIKGEVPLSELREMLRGRYRGLDQFTIDTDGLKAFILRLADPHRDDRLWLERLAAFLIHKPAEKWHDSDLLSAEFRLTELSKRVHELERLRLAYGSHHLNDGTDFEAVLIRTVRPGTGENERVVRIDPRRKKVIDAHTAELRTTLSKLDDPELKLALLAELMDETFMSLEGKSRSSVRGMPASRKEKGQNE